MVLKLRRNALQETHQVVAKRAQTSSSEGALSQKKAWKRAGVEALSQVISRPREGLEAIFSADDESEKEGELVSNTSLRHQNQHNKDPAIQWG